MTNKETFKVSNVKVAYHYQTIVRQDVKQGKYVKSKPIAFVAGRENKCDAIKEYYDKHPDRTQWFIYDAKRRGLKRVKARYTSDGTLEVDRK